MGGLNIPITATDNNVSSKLDQISRKIDELASKAQSSNNTMIDSNSKLGASFNALTTKVGASVAAIASVQKLNEIRQTITQVRGEFEQLEISLSTILGSKAEADKLMAQVVDFAAKTPFDMKGVASGVKQLLAYGSTADSVIDEMRMLGDIASGLSIPLGDMVYLFGTTRTQGRMFTQDLRQFMGRGIPLAEELAKQFGVTKAEVGDLVTAGKVGFNEMYQALQAMTSEGGKFYNLMDSQSRSILGMQSNAEDARDQMYNEIGKLLQGVTAKGIEAQNYLYENYEKIGRVLLELVGTYGVYKAVLITINALHKAQRVVLKEAVLQKKLASMANVTLSNSEAIAAARTSLLNKSMKGLLTTLKATSKAMLSNPYVLGAAAVAGLAYGIYKLVTAKSTEEKALEATNKRLQEYNDSIEKRLNNANDLISAMKDENKSSSERTESMRKLAQQYPQLLDKYGEEALMLMDIRDLKREIVGIESQNKKDQLTSDIETLSSALEKAKGGYQTILTMTRQEREMLSNLKIDANFSQDGQVYYDANSISAIKKALSELQKQFNDIKRAEAEAAFASKPLAERLEIYENRAEEARKKVKELNEEIDKLGNKNPSNGNIPNFFFTGKDSATLQSERDAQIKAAEEAEKNAEALRQKQNEEKKKAAADALKAQQKAQDDINKKLLQSDREREKARVQQQIDLLQYSTKAEKEKEEELHNLRKEMLQIEQAIALETLDLEYKKYKAIFEAAGKDTKPLDEAFAKLEQNTVNSFNDKSDKEDADYAKKKKDRDEQAIDDMIAYNEKYGNIMERRAAIVQKYARLIEKAENDAQKKTLKKEREAELREFDDTASGVYYEMFVDAEKATMKQIERAIELVKKKMQELLDKGINPASEEMQNLREQYEALVKSRSEKAFDNIGSGDIESLIKSILDYSTAKDKLSDAFENGELSDIKQAEIEVDQAKAKLDKNIAGTSITLFSTGLKKAAGYMRQIAEASGDIELAQAADAIEQFSENLSGFANAIANGPAGFIGFALKIITDMIGRFVAMASEAKAAKKMIDETTEAFVRYKFEIDSADYESAFGTDKIGLAAEAWEKAKAALDAYNEAVKWSYKQTGKNEYEVIGDLEGLELGGILKGYDKLQSLSIDTGQKGKNRYKTLKEVSDAEGWDIWDEEGNFNYENAQRFLDTYEGLTDEQRKQIENAVELQKAYEEAMKQIDEIASEIFGNLASEFADGIINAVESGEDAFKSFEKSAGNVIKNLGKMFLESMLYEKIFDAYSDQLKEAIGTGDAAQLTNLTGQMLEDMKNLYPELYDWYNNLIEQAKAQGVDMDAIAEQEATAKGFQAMSQETGDELNGRFTDIQAKSGMIAIGVNSLVQINNSIFQNTSAMLLQLGEMFGIQNLQLKELNTISKNTGYLISIFDEISALRRQFTDNIG